MTSATVLDYTISLFLLSAGTALLALIVFPVLLAVRALLRGSSEQRRLSKASARLSAIDSSLEERNWRSALDHLRDAFVYDLFSSRESIRQIREHNQNVLSRAVVLGEELATRAENLAEVERLLIENAEIQLLYLKANESFRRLKAKRLEASKELPDWTKSDYNKRTKEIFAELRENQTQIKKAIAGLLKSLEQPRGEEVTYH